MEIGRVIGMTENNKRFTTNNGVFYKDNETGWEFQSYGEVVELLNELHEENQRLQHFESLYRERNLKLEKVNKELKEGVEELNEICKYYEMRIKELSEQAEAVRTELQLCEEENNALQERNDRQAERLKFYRKTFGKWNDKRIKELNDD